MIEMILGQPICYIDEEKKVNVFVAKTGFGALQIIGVVSFDDKIKDVFHFRDIDFYSLKRTNGDCWQKEDYINALEKAKDGCIRTTDELPDRIKEREGYSNNSSYRIKNILGEYSYQCSK